MPGEKGQEVLRCGGCWRGKNASKISEKTNDFIGIFVFLAQEADVHAEVALAEALAVFVYQKGMMEECDPPTPFRGSF